MERGDFEAAGELLVGDADAERIPFFLDSRGRLGCFLGRFQEGLRDFLSCRDALDARGGRDSPGVVPWRSNAAVAYARLGDAEQARALASEDLRLARACGAPRAIGIALRALGLAEGSADHLRAAVSVLERSEARLELARALIDLGAALRRTRQRERSREPLRRGLDLAHRCGAHALADRAHAELLAAGARPRRRVLSGLDALTASERRVAELAGQGLSNRQIAQSLFISMKTVAVHLTHTYQKLGVAGRADLAELVHAKSLSA
jgi:DNA-binding CsgD family transcriptional regulator